MSDLEITLNGKSETLRPSLRVTQALAQVADFQTLADRIARFDFNTYVQIVSAAFEKRPIDVQESVFNTGMVELSGPLSKFVTILANGGKPLKASEDAKSGEA